MSVDITPSEPFVLFDDSTMWPGSFASIGSHLIAVNVGAFAVTQAWPTAATAMYIPFALERACTLYQMGWYNGSVLTGTREVGLYTEGGVKIISAAATAAGVSLLQMIDVTDTPVGPGLYYMAAVGSDTSNWAGWAPAAPLVPSFGVWTQVTADPLPSTATFAINQTVAIIPIPILQFRPTL